MSDRSAIYPLLFEPVLKSYIWGGRTLAERLGRALPAGNVAESWEIAAHEDGASIVSNGRFAGQSLTAVHATLGLDLIGTNSAWAQARGKFPLLVKLLDAHDKLSVQVHPNDEYALAHEGNELGKTEMWVVLHAEPGAQVILSVRAGTTAADFRQTRFNTLIERPHSSRCRRHIPVRPAPCVVMSMRTIARAKISGVWPATTPIKRT